MSHTTNILSAITGLGLTSIAVLLIICFHIKTALIANRIKLICRSENITWTFWGDVNQLLAFVFDPKKLIDENDTIRVVEAKKQIVAHRESMWRTIVLSCVLLCAAFVGVLTIQLLMN